MYCGRAPSRPRTDYSLYLRASHHSLYPYCSQVYLSTRAALGGQLWRKSYLCVASRFCFDVCSIYVYLLGVGLGLRFDLCVSAHCSSTGAAVVLRCRSRCVRCSSPTSQAARVSTIRGWKISIQVRTNTAIMFPEALREHMAYQTEQVWCSLSPLTSIPPLRSLSRDSTLSDLHVADIIDPTFGA